MPALLSIELLGEFHVSCDDDSVALIHTPRFQHLLAYLILHRKTRISRRHLALLFWPDRSEKQALSNLRNLLHLVRKVLPHAEEYIYIDNRTLQWNAGTSTKVDLITFDELLLEFDQHKSKGNSEEAILLLKKAVSTYSGELLPDCHDEWIQYHRDQLKRKYQKALNELVLLLEAKRDLDTAIHYAHLWTQNDPYNEPGWYTLLHLYAQNQDVTSAARAYRQYTDTLWKHLQLKPSAKIRSYYEQLIQGLQNESESPLLKLNPNSGEWPLVGRKREWETIIESWKHVLSGKKKCVIIKGEPGVGITRLGLELLHSLRNQGYGIAFFRCYESARYLSYLPIINWYQQDLFRKQLSLIDPVWLPELKKIVPELRIEHPETEIYASELLKPNRRELYEAITQTAISGKQGRALFIDDLHWCDEKTLEWISYLFHSDHTAKLMLVCTVTTSEIKSNAVMQRVLDELKSSGNLTEVTLGVLSQTEMAELVSGAAHVHIDEADVEWIYRESEGLPLFITEAIKERLREDKPSSVVDFSEGEHNTVKQLLPGKVRNQISTRLRSLSAPARQLMELAAVKGREIKPEMLRRLTDWEPLYFIDAIEELLDRQIIREYEPGKYEFSHKYIRQVALDELSRVRYQWLFERIAEDTRDDHSGNDQPSITF